MDRTKETDDELKKHGKVHKDKRRAPEKQLPPHAEDIQNAARLAAEPGATTAERARKTTLLQKKVGNTKAAQMLSDEQPKHSAGIAPETKTRDQDQAAAGKTSKRKDAES